MYTWPVQADLSSLCVSWQQRRQRLWATGDAAIPILSLSALRSCFCFSSRSRCWHHFGNLCCAHPDKTFLGSEVIQPLKSPAQSSGLERWAAVIMKRAPPPRETLFRRVCIKTVNPQHRMREAADMGVNVLREQEEKERKGQSSFLNFYSF